MARRAESWHSSPVGEAGLWPGQAPCQRWPPLMQGTGLECVFNAILDTGSHVGKGREAGVAGGAPRGGGAVC